VIFIFAEIQKGSFLTSRVADFVANWGNIRVVLFLAVIAMGILSLLAIN
jgi:hypothetical protein